MGIQSRMMDRSGEREERGREVGERNVRLT